MRAKEVWIVNGSGFLNRYYINLQRFLQKDKPKNPVLEAQCSVEIQAFFAPDPPDPSEGLINAI